MAILQKCLGTFPLFIFSFDIHCVSRKFTTFSCLYLVQKCLLIPFILSVVLERTAKLAATVTVVLEDNNNNNNNYNNYFIIIL